MAEPAALDSAADEPRSIELTDAPARLAAEVLRTGQRSFESWLPRTGQTASPRAIHQLRVTLRRLRVALRLFADVVPADCKKLRAELAWFGRELSHARDLDVHADILRGAREAMPTHAAAITRLEARNDAARATARSRLARTFESERLTRLRADLEALAARDLEAAAPGDTDIGKVCTASLAKSLKRLRKRGRKLDADSSAADLHEVRIRSKRLRYELEFFENLVPGLEPLLRAARRLQNILGAHNDAVVAVRRLREQADERPGIVEDGTLDAAIRRQKKAAAQARGRLKATWRRFERAAATAHLPD